MEHHKIDYQTFLFYDLREPPFCRVNETEKVSCSRIHGGFNVPYVGGEQQTTKLDNNTLS